MIEARDLTVTYDGRAVLQQVTLTVPDGGHIALMGPSGCGKTTLLRILAGLQAPDSGTVRVEPGRMACVFQEPRLLPWRTAAENVNAVLSDRAQTMPQALAWLERSAARCMRTPKARSAATDEVGFGCAAHFRCHWRNPRPFRLIRLTMFGTFSSRRRHCLTTSRHPPLLHRQKSSPAGICRAAPSFWGVGPPRFSPLLHKQCTQQHRRSAG